MKKKGLLLDAGIGLLLTAFVAGSYLVKLPFLESVEFMAYDLRAKFRQNLTPPPEIVLVAIDDDSISQIGRWPWPRTRLAAAVEKIQSSGPKVIGLNILLSEAEQNQGLIEVRRLEGVFKELVAGKKLTQKGVDFTAEFSSAAIALDSDSKLEASIRAAGDVVLPLFFTPAQVGAKVEAVPPFVSSGSIAASAGLEQITEEGKIVYPQAAFGEASAGFGHVNLYAEVDGAIRREAPLVKYGSELYPSYALRLTMAYLGLQREDLSLEPGRALKVGKIEVPLDSENMMAVTFNGPAGETTRVVSYRDVMGDKVDPALFKDKIVIVGPTALGIATLYVTPVAQGFPSMEVVATIVENILHQRFLTRPPWAENAELGLIAVVGLFIMLVLPRLRAFWGLIASLVLLVGLLGGGLYLFMNGQWVKVGYPMVLLAVGYLIIISKSFLVTEKGKELVEASQIETNKMLGLSFQGQGMLDMAFEKFRLCPLDDNMKDTLYNLSLDFERKRQFSKAGAVLEHIAAKDPKYKDVVEKAAKLKQASEGAVFGGVGGAKKEGTVMIAGGSTKPTLGRYEIEKELGRGAMGVVYLGKDPKINRMVAIKTMMMEEGTDSGSVKEIKERFFREAESAGTLNHPNIVRIFDAGEESDICYIAMELLDGHDLVRYGTKDGILPLEKAVDYIATVADALDYAHQQGIVHRDIKPANVMLLKDGTIRVADFGIARISASSKTATGTVMGTPSYMSPEQVAGKKVDGRSDLFSLAVALFELTTGEKPFKGGEGIGTLLFQIANDPHPDLLAVKPGLPAALKSVVDKGLAKKPEDRFQRGSEFAAALRGALKGVSVAAPAPALDATKPSFAASVPGQHPGPATPPVTASVRTAEITAPTTDFPTTPLPPAPVSAADKTASVPGATHPGPSPEKTLGPTIPGFGSPASTPAPAPKPAATPDSEKTIGPVIPGFTMPKPKPLTPIADKTAPAQAPAPAPAPKPADTLPSIELGTRGGTGAPAAVPPPPALNADGTMRLEPGPNLDATIRIKPNPQEPL